MLDTHGNENLFHHTANTPDKDAFHRHMHNGYELFYFVRGDAEYIIEGSTYRLKAGDMLFIHPRKFHYLKPLSDAVYERYVIHFTLDGLSPDICDFVKSTREIYRVGKGSLAERFFGMWAEAERLFSDTEMNEYLFSSLVAILLYVKYLPEEHKVTPVRADPTLERILQYIDSHPEEQLTADTLSAKFYMSSSWIVHSVRNALGISLMQYVQKKRILYAEALIISGMNPTEVAKHCNYESYSTFYRQYKKILGISPMDTRKRAVSL